MCVCVIVRVCVCVLILLCFFNNVDSIVVDLVVVVLESALYMVVYKYVFGPRAQRRCSECVRHDFSTSLWRLGIGHAEPSFLLLFGKDKHLGRLFFLWPHASSAPQRRWGEEILLRDALQCLGRERSWFGLFL